MRKWILRLVLPVVGVILILVIYVGILMYQADTISKGNPIPEYNETKTALLVIDVQEGTTGKFSTYSNYIKQADDLIYSINSLIDLFDSLNLPVIYVQQQNENPIINFLSGNELSKGAESVNIDGRIQMVSGHIFTKEIMDAFSNPELDNYLLENRVNRLFITGLDAAYCANKTTYAAYNRGYKTFIVEDAIISETSELKMEKLEEFRQAGIKIKNTNNLKHMLLD
jgi:nicotinamidase/pyrazinamidase